MKKLYFIFGIFFLATSAFGQNITPGFLRGHLRFLADDLLEGRGPGTRGGELATKYIASQLEALGVEPGNGTSYFQNVSMVGLTVERGQTMQLQKNGKKTLLNFGADFVAWTPSQQAEIKVQGELVFLGYGITAPEFQWDDFKGTDLHGKIGLILVNDPPSEDPAFFEGKAMTYYGRWIYKLEEARRRGLLGAFVVHKLETAGYPWHVVENSAGGEQFSLKATVDTKYRMQLAGWISSSTAEKMAELSGVSWPELEAKAKEKSFHPIPLGVTLETTLKSAMRSIESPNVVAIHRGSNPKLKDSYVLYCSHWDHLGIGKPNEKGDRIYNGALDNASGVASLLALAKAYSTIKTDRSVIFLFPTAEETGLLGSEYYVKHPLFPLEQTVGVINFDEVNVWGKTTDIFSLGNDRTTMENSVKKVAKKMKLSLGKDFFPEKGTFFRSDHWTFARMGIPATSVEFGQNFVGKPEGWGMQKSKDFSANHYHEPSDEVQPDWDYSGTVQHVEFALLLGLELARSKNRPVWKDGRRAPQSARFDEKD